MIATLIALLAAHILADFVLQTDWMVREKRRPMVQLLHGAIVLGTAMLFTGQIIPGKRLIALALSHLIIDAIKIYATRGGLAAFLVDQSAHLVALSLVALWSQDLWATGIWVTGFGPVGLPGILLPPEVQNALLHGMVLISGAILAIRAGKFALKMLMDGQQKKHPPAPATGDTPDPGLPDGGEMIGLLERGLIFALIVAGQPDGIGFLIAAKSILRFGSLSAGRAASEYIIIGTLASFGWAITIGMATVMLRDALPPLIP